MTILYICRWDGHTMSGRDSHGYLCYKKDGQLTKDDIDIMLERCNESSVECLGEESKIERIRLSCIKQDDNEVIASFPLESPYCVIYDEAEEKRCFEITREGKWKL